MNLSEAKLRQLDAATTYRVYGHEIESEGGATGKGEKASRRWRLISPCVCVHDSPDSPCPCMLDESRWWLRGEHVIDEGNAGRKDHDGQELRFFDVLVDSKIMVESLQPVSAGALKKLGDTISPERVRDLASDSGFGVTPFIAKPFRDISDVFRTLFYIDEILASVGYDKIKEALEEKQKGKGRPT